MRHLTLLVAASAATLALAAPAHAQALSGEELRGQTVDITFADGARNSVFFGSTGMATVSNTTGQSATANWFVQGNELCLRAGAANECWNYSNRFAAGEAIELTSTCDQSAVWTPRGVNAPRQMVAPEAGERG